tara:strand:+ start:1025 stop:1213 length:189 start_codon:yes stop_codon:yes gene_type:complete
MLIGNNKKLKPNFDVIWLFQLIASTSWMISVFIYGSFAPGDYLQLMAASSWTMSNIISPFKR